MNLGSLEYLRLTKWSINLKFFPSIDGRGSGFRGDDLLFQIHYKLGQPEVQDQIDVTKDLLNRYTFIDKSKVAIWGWSYGGKY